MIPSQAAIAYLGLVAVVSVISFAAFGFDKRRAATGGQRVPERTFLLLTFVGGWPGAWLGQRYFRHKTQKVSFRVVFWLLVVMHITVVGLAAYLMFGPITPRL